LTARTQGFGFMLLDTWFLLPDRVVPSGFQKKWFFLALTYCYYGLTREVLFILSLSKGWLRMFFLFLVVDSHLSYEYERITLNYNRSFVSLKMTRSVILSKTN